jgi:hypothetical protein
MYAHFLQYILTLQARAFLELWNMKYRFYFPTEIFDGRLSALSDAREINWGN